MLKQVKYFNDPFQHFNVFRLHCYHRMDTEEYGTVTYEKSLYFRNEKLILNHIERLVFLSSKLREWKRWLDEPAHSDEEYKEKWNGKENYIIKCFREIYALLQNYAIEQFALVDFMNPDDSGFRVYYIDEHGVEYDLTTDNVYALSEEECCQIG